MSLPKILTRKPKQQDADMEPTGMLAKASPEYHALTSKLNELTAELSDLRVEESALARRLEANGTSQHGEAAVARARDIAEALGGPLSEIMPAVSLEDRTQLTAIQRRQAAIIGALEILRPKISDAKIKASVIVREQVSPEHRELVRGICKALIAAHEANSLYWKFAEALNVEGVWWSALGPSQPIRLLGAPRDAQGPVAQYLRTACRDGHIAASEIPGELRE